MAPTTLVSELAADGQAVVDRLVADGVALDAAFWGQLYDDDRPYLYIVSPDYKLGPIALAANIRRAVTALREQQPSILGLLLPSDIQMLSPDDETARRVARDTRLHRGRTPVGHPLDGLYIYALPAPTPA